MITEESKAIRKCRDYNKKSTKKVKRRNHCLAKSLTSLVTKWANKKQCLNLNREGRIYHSTHRIWDNLNINIQVSKWIVLILQTIFSNNNRWDLNHSNNYLEVYLLNQIYLVILKITAIAIALWIHN